MSSARPHADARLDTEQAERVSEALALQKTKGSAAATLYMEVHGVGPATMLRVLLSQRSRPEKPAIVLSAQNYGLSQGCKTGTKDVAP